MEMTEHMAEAGARIAAARRRLGMTQAALAAAVAVSRSAVAQWETGRTGQLGLHLPRLASALGVSIAHLLTGADETVPPQVETSQEWALLRLYRALDEDRRQDLLRHAQRLARAGGERT